MPSLEEIQRALAARLTQPIEDSAEPSVILESFDEQELEQSRETLLRKRVSQLGGLLPRTRAELDTRFQPLAREFANSHHSQGSDAVRWDAVTFSRWLGRQADIPRQVRRIASVEALQIEWSCRKLMCKLRRGEGRSWWIALRIGNFGDVRRCF